MDEILRKVLKFAHFVQLLGGQNFAGLLGSGAGKGENLIVLGVKNWVGVCPRKNRRFLRCLLGDAGVDPINFKVVFEGFCKKIFFF
jgi:hypothetical protein